MSTRGRTWLLRGLEREGERCERPGGVREHLLSRARVVAETYLYFTKYGTQNIGSWLIVRHCADDGNSVYFNG